MSEQEAHAPAANGASGRESEVNLSNHGDAPITGQIGVVNGDANFYFGDSPAMEEEPPATAMIARASGGSRINQAGRDQTVISP
jgi:hypothetical protein